MTPAIEFSHATNRNTQAYLVHFLGTTTLFSYETPVGFIDDKGKRIRRENVWGPTTGRHLNESGFSYNGIEQLDEDEFVKRMNEGIAQAIAAHAERMMSPT